MYKIMLVVLVVLIIGGGVMAQDDSPCAGELGELHDTMGESLLEMDTAVGNDDLDGWLRGAFALRWYLSGMDAYCRGFAWDSETEGNQPVLGPVMFPDGLYRATVVTDGYFTLQITTIEGTCEPRRGTSLFILSRGDATEGAQATFEASDCIALLEISNVTEPWTLHFELIGGD